jgi:hypothetical protein
VLAFHRHKILSVLLIAVAALSIVNSALATSFCPHDDACCVEQPLVRDSLGSFLGNGIEGGVHGSIALTSKSNSSPFDHKDEGSSNRLGHCRNQNSGAPESAVLSKTDDSCDRCVTKSRGSYQISVAFAGTNGNIGNVNETSVEIWQAPDCSQPHTFPDDHSPPALVQPLHIVHRSFRI